MALFNIIFENLNVFCVYFRCPSARKDYNRERCKKYFCNLDGKKQIVPSFICIILLRYYVSLMKSNELCENNEKQLKLFYKFISEDSAIYHFITDEINRNISAQPLR